MTRRYSNTAVATTLASDINSSTTAIQVSATTGFPAADFVLALDYGMPTQELVLVTGIAGTNLTVTRGYDSTSNQAHSTGAPVRHVHSAADLRDSRTHEEATTGVHGVSGALVGTSSSQALTNKDLSSGNTFPSSLATGSQLSAHAALTATHGATGAVVGTTNTQTLMNKDLSSGTNTFPGTLATDAEVSSAVAAHTALTATHGAAGAVVGTTNTQTLTNKTLTTPTVNSPTIADPVINGVLGGNVFAFTSYTPVIRSGGSGGTAFTIGNGTLTGRYARVGPNLVHVEIKLVRGSTTNVGSDKWWFQLPISPTGSIVAGCLAGSLLNNAGSSARGVTGWLNDADGFVLAAANDYVGPVPPWGGAWASGDQVNISGTYAVA